MGSVSLRKAAGRIFAGLFGAVLLLSVSPCFAQQKDAADDVKKFLGGEIDFSTIDLLCNQSILSDQPVSQLVGAIEKIAKDSSLTKEQRSNAFLAISFIGWRQGEMSDAIQAAKDGLKIKESGQLLVQLAKLLDATGSFEEARKQYQKAIPHLSGQELEKIRVRVTLLQSEGNVKPLIELAKTKDDSFKNRAAVALAILGHEKEASGLFVVDAEAKRSTQFRQKVRLAEWAIRAKDIAAAKKHAWESVALAKLKRDRRYGLALLVESHRMDDSIPALIDKLKEKASLTEDENFVLVELFRETKQYNEAISLFKASSGTWTQLLKRQLIGLYRESGRNEDIQREFGSLITSEPSEVSWPKGLAEHFLERGKKKEADKLWQEFIERNSRSSDLLAAAEAMAQLGQDDLAIQAAKKARTNERTYAIGSLFLFELYLSRGQQENATRVLDQLGKDLPAKSLSRRDLADGYERLSQPKKALQVWKGLYDNGVELGVDGEMRIAWLQQSVGKNEEALASWYAMLEKTPATQRRLVEDRILTLSAQLGRLGKTAVALEEKILNKTADEKDARMLIKIYTKAGDAGSAVEIIEEYFGDGDSKSKNIVMLREKAQIFRFLGEYKDYEKVTKQLVEVDTKHRLEHLRSLILNHIENTTVNAHDPNENNARRAKELKELIFEHNKYGDGESAREFEAGVLDLAGDKEQAISVYRKALAENPNRGDNYLVMANLMKSTEQTKAAVRMFQFLAERTERDDLFVIAMDGLLNMQDNDPSVLKWAKRITLERLTRKSDKSYLYSLLADLADDSRDVSTQIAALENSLSHANSRRATTLRELIVLTDPNSRIGNRPKKPDVVENLKYSRRLIALRQSFPPEVFVNMGKAFLSAGEPVNAQKAFTMAVDSTGRADLMVEAARQFENGSYIKEALAQYEKALIANKGDLEILWRLGQLKEQAGWNDAANQLYFDGLKGILSRHPIHVESNRISELVYVNSALDIPSDVRQDPSKTDEYKRHYYVLRDGFIRTLPSDPQAREKSLAWFRSEFKSEVEKAAKSHADANGRMVNFPKLNVLSQFLRYVALSAGDYGNADMVDRTLLSDFHNDRGLVKVLVEQRREWGQADFAGSVSTYSNVSAEAKEQVRSLWTVPPAAPSQFVAVKSGKSRSLWGFRGNGGNAANHERKLNVAVLGGDQKAVLETCKSLVKDNFFPRAVLHGRNLLDDVHFGLLCQYIVRRVKGNKERVATVLGNARTNFGINQVDTRESWLDIVESVAGEPIVSFDDMITYVENAKYIYQLNFKYVLKHLDSQGRIRFLKAIGNSSKVKQSKVLKLLAIKAMLRFVLDQPISNEEQVIWLGLLKANVEKNDQIRRAQNIQFFNNLRFAKENSEFVKNIAAQLDPSGKLLKPGSIISVRIAIAQGNTEEALKQWIDCYLKGAFMPNLSSPASRQSMFRFYSEQFIENTFEDVLKQNRDEFYSLIDKHAKTASAKKKLVELQLKLIPYFEKIEPGIENELLKGLAKKYPENQQIYRQLLASVRSQGDIASAIQLQLANEKSPANVKANQRQLYQDWLTIGNPVKALALKPKPIQRPRPGTNPAGKRRITRPIIRRRTSPQSELRKAVAAGDEKKIRSLVRKMWQSVAVTMGQVEYSYGQDAFSRMELAQFVKMNWPNVPGKKKENSTTKPKSASPKSLCEGLAEYPFSVEEFQGWIRALRADEIDTAYPIFKSLAYAIGKHRNAIQVRDQLAASIFENRQGDKGVTLWLALLEANPDLVDESNLQKINQLIARNVPMRRSQLLAMAHIFARSKKMEEAARMYRSALCALVNRNMEYQNDRNRPTVLGLVQEAKEHLSPEFYHSFLTEVLHLTKPPFGQGLEVAYAQFGMSLLAKSVEDKEFNKLYGNWVKEHLAKSGTWVPEQAIQAAGMLKRASAYPQALDVLQQSLEPQPTQQRFSGIEYGVGYKQMLGIDRWRQQVFRVPGSRLPQNSVSMFDELFPTKNSDDQLPWLRSVASKLDSWFSDQKLDSKKVLILAEVVFKRLEQSNEKEDSKVVLVSVAKHFQESKFYSANAANKWVSLAGKAGLPLDLAVCHTFLKNKLLRPEQIVSVLERTSSQQGPASALGLGEAVSSYCLDDRFLKLMASAAEKVQNQDAVAKYQKLQATAEAARKQLKIKTPSSKTS